MAPNLSIPALVLTGLLLFSCSSKPVKKNPPPSVKKGITFTTINFLKSGKVLRNSAFSTGKTVLTAVSDVSGGIYVYSLPDLMLVRTIPARDSRCIGLGFLNGGADLVALYGDDTVRLFPVRGGAAARVLPLSRNAGPLRALGTFPAGGKIVVGNSRGDLFLSNSNATAFVSRKTPLKAVNYIRFSPDGRTLVLAGGRNCVTAASESGKMDEKTVLESPPVAFAFTPDSKFLAAGTLFWRVHLLETGGLDRKGEFEINMDPVSSLAFHPSRKWLIVGSGKTARGTLHILSLPGLKLLTKTTLQMEEIIGIASLGREFVLVSGDGTIQVLRASGGEGPAGKKAAPQKS